MIHLMSHAQYTWSSLLLSYTFPTILSHQIIIKVLPDGLYDEGSVLSQLRTRQHVMRKVSWQFIINNQCFKTYLIFLKGEHHTNELYFYSFSKILSIRR